MRLTVVGSQAEADVVCGLLRANGIRCNERPVDMAAEPVAGVGGWTEILVTEDDLDTARELLAASPPAE